MFCEDAEMRFCNSIGIQDAYSSQLSKKNAGLAIGWVLLTGYLPRLRHGLGFVVFSPVLGHGVRVRDFVLGLWPGSDVAFRLGISGVLR